MSKYIKLLVISLLFISTNVYASTNTCIRTIEDTKVTKYELNETNIDIALATPCVNAEEKIYDFADLFTDEEEASLYTEIKEYISEYNMDLVVVTIDENNKGYARDYADDFYDYNDFGIGNEHDGVLFLIDMDTREMYISTTGLAIKVYTDSNIDDILDKTYMYLTKERYYFGTSEVIRLMSDDAYGDLTTKGRIMKVLPFSCISGIIITCVWIGILVSRNKMVNIKHTAEDYVNQEETKINKVSDKLVSTFTTKHKIDHDTSSGGGSSTHSSSSGASHGGGGHGF